MILAALPLSAWKVAACPALLARALLTLGAALLQGSKALKNVCTAAVEVSILHLNILPAVRAAWGSECKTNVAGTVHVQFCIGWNKLTCFSRSFLVVWDWHS